MPNLLYSNWHQLFDKEEELLPDVSQSTEALVRHCTQRLLGVEAAANFPHHDRLVQLLLREDRRPDEPPRLYNDNDRRHQFAQLWAFLAMTPQFQYR